MPPHATLLFVREIGFMFLREIHKTWFFLLSGVVGAPQNWLISPNNVFNRMFLLGIRVITYSMSIFCLMCMGMIESANLFFCDL